MEHPLCDCEIIHEDIVREVQSRQLDSETYIGSFKVPLLRNGFRMVVFSVVIMIVVLFFRRGIMGEKELPDLFRKRKKAPVKEAAE